MNAEHPKPVFRPAPVEDDLTSVILTTRLLVFEDSKLDEGTRLMFGYLLDLSLRRSTNVRPGVVSISDTQLAERLGCSRRTIFHRKQALEQAHCVWLSHQAMPNSWPLTTYHVTAIDRPKAHVEKTTEQGLWGNGSRRQGPVGNLLPKGQKTAENAQVPDIAAGTGNPLPASQATCCLPHGQPVAPETSNLLPATRATSCPGDEQPVARGTSNQLPVGPATCCSHKKTQEEGKSHFKGVCPFTPPEFEELDWKMAPRLRGQWAAEAIRVAEQAIQTIKDDHRSLEPDGKHRTESAKAVVRQYRERISALKRWAVGQK